MGTGSAAHRAGGPRAVAAGALQAPQGQAREVSRGERRRLRHRGQGERETRSDRGEVQGGEREGQMEMIGRISLRMTAATRASLLALILCGFASAGCG